MKTSGLRKFNRVYRFLLAVLFLGATLLVLTQPGRLWVSNHAKELAAALFFKAQPGQTWTVYTPPHTFYVRSYGGKCLDFGAPSNRITGVLSSAPSSSAVIINDCNGTIAQQVRVEELTDRPGHLVILRAGSGVIGKKISSPGYIRLTLFGAPVAPSTNSAEPVMLEVQPYNGSEGQIFAFDGDSILLAADRNQVVEVQNNRGANKTPLVLGRRDLDDSEFWTFTATDSSTRRPTSGFKRVSRQETDVLTASKFVEAVIAAQGQPGTVVEIDEDANIDLTNQPSVFIPAGVTIRGNRRLTTLGPELSSNSREGMLIMDGNDVRITGLRLRGPSRSSDEDTTKAVGIRVRDDLYTRGIIDHNELSEWPETAVIVNGGEEAKICVVKQYPENSSRPARAENIRIARNFIHHNQRQNGGYGVGTYDSGYPVVEGNTFVSNRHAIASDGWTRTGYRALYNLVLSEAPKQDRPFWPDDYTHDFDVHGTGAVKLVGLKELTRGFGGTAGLYFEIAWNTFLGTNRQNFDLRGEPCDLIELHHNISLKSPGDAIACTYCGGGINKLKVYDTNQFNTLNPTNRLGVGDFDGDGRDDLFLATGAAWYYSSAASAEWRFINVLTDKIDSLRFGDFDGDGRTDVFTQHGNNWDVSWGGASKWETINTSAPALSDFAIGDFDGDHRADVFYANGYEWLVSFGGVGAWSHFAFAIHRVSDLKFGDFNGDDKTDVFGIVGDYWQVVYGGTQFWATLRPKQTAILANLRVADFDGDGRADLLSPGLYWYISRGGTGDWTLLSKLPSTLAAIGRFDGQSGADILLWNNGNYLDLLSSGSAAPIRQSPQDMR